MILSICIPTHDGRAAELAELLDSIARQLHELDRDQLEICISDNASRDSTATLVGAFEAKHGVRTVYKRFETNRGLAANLLSVVDLASGDWCWLTGSDEASIDGGLRYLMDALRAEPQVAGVVFKILPFSSDLSERWVMNGEAFSPPQTEPTIFSGVNDVISNIGIKFTSLCSNVVKREVWLEAAALHRDQILADNVWPQVTAMVGMVLLDPRWLWLPEPIVIHRSGRMFMLNKSSSRWVDNSVTISKMALTFKQVVRPIFRGQRRAYRRFMDHWYEVVFYRSAIDDYKRPAIHGIRMDLGMFYWLARAFWWRKQFWLDAPLLLTPAPLIRARAKRLRSRRPIQSPATETVKTVLAIDLPPRIFRRDTLSLQGTVKNSSSDPIGPTKNSELWLAYQWISQESGEVAYEGIAKAFNWQLESNRRVEFDEAFVQTPWEDGSYELRFTLALEGQFRFDDLNVENGLRRQISVERVDVPVMV